MLIAVKSCAAHWDRCAAIRDTWWTPDVHFFTGDELGVPDSYDALPLKTREICRWAIKHGHSDVFFCDTDTYVCVPRLRTHLCPYIGYRLHEKDYASGGAGYWLDDKALQIVAQADAARFKLEDEFVGTVLKEAGIPLFNDHRYSLFEDVLPENTIRSRHLSSRTFFEIPMMYEAHERANGR